jgi:hypothetical protein
MLLAVLQKGEKKMIFLEEDWWIMWFYVFKRNKNYIIKEFHFKEGDLGLADVKLKALETIKTEISKSRYLGRKKFLAFLFPAKIYKAKSEEEINLYLGDVFFLKPYFSNRRIFRVKDPQKVFSREKTLSVFPISPGFGL